VRRPCAQWRVPATAGSLWSNSRRWMAATRCSANWCSIRRCRSPTYWPGGKRQPVSCSARAADSTLLARLESQARRPRHVGSATFEIRSVINRRADKLGGGVGLGPRFLVSEAGCRGPIVAAGQLVRWIYRVKLPANAAGDRAAAALTNDARSTLPEQAGRFAAATTLAPLERTSTLHPVSRFGRPRPRSGRRSRRCQCRQKPHRSTPRRDRYVQAVGATGRDVFTIYLTRSSARHHRLGEGLTAGAALPFIVVGAFGSLPAVAVVPALHPDELALSFIYGLLTALAFGLWPLGRCMTCRWRAVPGGGGELWHRRDGVPCPEAVVIASLIAGRGRARLHKGVAGCRSVAPRFWCSRCCAASPAD